MQYDTGSYLCELRNHGWIVADFINRLGSGVLNLFNNSLESFWIVEGEIGKNLAVDLYA